MKSKIPEDITNFSLSSFALLNRTFLSAIVEFTGITCRKEPTMMNTVELLAFRGPKQ